jgi:hypothetical protein
MPGQGDPTDADRTRDKDELRAFAYGLRALLRTIVEDSRLISEDRGEDVPRAWERVQDRFTELIASLDELSTRSSQWEPLDEHGLTGDELRLKLRGFWGGCLHGAAALIVPGFEVCSAGRTRSWAR